MFLCRSCTLSYILLATLKSAAIEKYGKATTTITTLKRNDNISNRFLRGGSYGGGGRSSWGGGGSWSRNGNNYHTNSNNNNSRYNNNRGSGMSRFGKAMAITAAGIIGLLLLGALFPALGVGSCCASLLCCGLGTAAGAAAASSMPGQQKQSMYNAFNGDGGEGQQQQQQSEIFQENVERAKLEVEAARSFMQIAVTPFAPFSGDYVTSYVDGGVARSANLNIHFTNLGNNTGYKISGSGKDIDGTTVIEDGHANMDGTTWWRECTTTGDVGLQVLSRGKFDFQNRTFDGTWFASSGQGGSYLSFRVNQNSTVYATPVLGMNQLSSQNIVGENHYAMHGGEKQHSNHVSAPVIVTGTVIPDPNNGITTTSNVPAPYVPHTAHVTGSSVPTPYVQQSAPPVTVVAQPVDNAT